MNKLIPLVLALSHASLIGASAAEKPKSAAQSQKATCYVCKYNRDLACVEFTPTPKTPRAYYAGEEYCFCGEDCRKAFEKKPEKYLRKQR